MTPLEIAANAVATLSVALAARNSVHTWPAGIVGCVLFSVVFFQAQLYADATLQVFFIVTSVIGWRQWQRRGEHGDVAETPVGQPATPPAALPITHADERALAWRVLLAALVTLAYGGLLHRFTDAYLPYVDAAVLGLSVVAQLLLMQRKMQTWPFWLAVNTLSVPLFASRGLTLTAALYAAYWLMAWYGWWRWRREAAGPVLAAELAP